VPASAALALRIPCRYGRSHEKLKLLSDESNRSVPIGKSPSPTLSPKTGRVPQIRNGAERAGHSSRQSGKAAGGLEWISGNPIRLILGKPWLVKKNSYGGRCRHAVCRYGLFRDRLPVLLCKPSICATPAQRFPAKQPSHDLRSWVTEPVQSGWRPSRSHPHEMLRFQLQEAHVTPGSPELARAPGSTPYFHRVVSPGQ